MVLASLGGYVLAGAALRPIEAMRRRAADISASSLDDRLPVPRTKDEVSRLGETLNEMLSRIGDGLARERRFVADASHELRTPLALLKTELELALRRARTTEELEAAIRAAAEDTERLSRIADDLLLLARAERGRVPLTARGGRRRRCSRLGRRALPATRRARAAGAWRSPPVTHSSSRPIACCSSRRSATSSTTRSTTASGRITLQAERRNGVAELHVLDQGRGFSADLLERAFERFSRGPRRRRTGAGSAWRSSRRSRTHTKAMRRLRTPRAAAPTSGSRSRWARCVQAQGRARTAPGRRRARDLRGGACSR